MTYIVEGKITDLEAKARQVSDSFRVRDFVVETPGDYPQLVRLSAVQDKVDMLDAFAVGDTVKVSFDLRGKRSAQGRVFTDLQAWRVEAAGAQSPAPSAPTSGGSFEDDAPFDRVRGVL